MQSHSMLSCRKAGDAAAENLLPIVINIALQGQINYCRKRYNFIGIKVLLTWRAISYPEMKSQGIYAYVTSSKMCTVGTLCCISIVLGD